MTLEATNVLQNQVWQLNRTMEFRFTEPVDAGTLNLSTISVVRNGGGPTSGRYFLIDARTVGFQPTCPTTGDYSDGGLVPGGVSYVVHVVGSTTGGATVRSASGAPLSQGYTATIVTPE